MSTEELVTVFCTSSRSDSIRSCEKLEARSGQPELKKPIDIQDQTATYGVSKIELHHQHRQHIQSLAKCWISTSTHELSKSLLQPLRQGRSLRYGHRNQYHEQPHVLYFEKHQKNLIQDRFGTTGRPHRMLVSKGEPFWLITIRVLGVVPYWYK